MRLAKVLRINGRRLDVGFDLYNIFNAKYESHDEVEEHEEGADRKVGSSILPIEYPRNPNDDACVLRLGTRRASGHGL